MGSKKRNKHLFHPEDVVWPARQEDDDNIREYVTRVSDDDDEDSQGSSIRKVRVSEDNSRTKKRWRSKDEGEKKDGDSTSRVYNEGEDKSKKRNAPSTSRYSGGGDNPSILLDWYNTSGWTRHMGFDLELWWSRSGMMHRLNAGLVVLCLAIFFMNLAFGIWLICVSFMKPIRSPYTCETEECQQAALWMSSTMNKSVEPCDNFYEFVCGKYRQETEKQGDRFDNLIKAPSFAIEFGENSILAKILKNYRHDKTEDGAIKYYQACLNLPKRKQFGMKAFIKLVEHVFGTCNFTTFEGSNVPMEDIGYRMFKVVGHASYINMAFFSYPYIQILQPSLFVKNLHVGMMGKDGKTWNNAEFVSRTLHGLMPILGVPADSKIIKEMIAGVNLMTHILQEIQLLFRMDQFERTLEALKNNQAAQDKIQQNFIDKKLCPPMGIQLDMHKVLSLFVQEDFTLDFIDLMAVKYFGILTKCFEQPPSSFSFQQFTYPKSAFVALWLVELFWEYHITMDSQYIMTSWGITPKQFPDNEFVLDRDDNTDIENDSEFPCLIALYRHLGYVPTIRYLLSITDNPAEMIGKLEDDITDMFYKFSDIFERIPKGEIVTVGAHLGKIQFARGMYIDVGMPLVSGLLDSTSVADFLPFTDDHLKNSIIATEYTVEKGRQNWIGSTNSYSTMRWWGSGSPSEMRSELLDLREPMHVPALFLEKSQPGQGKGQWSTFLGRGYPNYLLYPLSLIGEPHVTETMALYSSGYSEKILRSFLSIVEHQFFHDRYPSVSDENYYWVGNPQTDNGGNRTCSVLHNEEPRPPPELTYSYSMHHNYTMFDFTWVSEANFFAVLALKESFRLFRKDMRTLRKAPFDWSVPQNARNMRMRRFLPGSKMSRYTEEQLYFISYVRHTCRGSWKTHYDNYREQRWLLETEILTILMQMEEFASVWKCPPKSFMNNFGQPRCIRWVPS